MIYQVRVGTPDLLEVVAKLHAADMDSAEAAALATETVSKALNGEQPRYLAVSVSV